MSPLCGSWSVSQRVPSPLEATVTHKFMTTTLVPYCFVDIKRTEFLPGPDGVRTVVESDFSCLGLDVRTFKQLKYRISRRTEYPK